LGVIGARQEVCQEENVLGARAGEGGFEAATLDRLLQPADAPL